MSIAPGWYPDPADPTTTRYWDGEGWVDPTSATEVQAAPQPVAGQQPPATPGVTAPPWWPEGFAYPPHGLVTPHGLSLASPSRRLAARAVDLAVLAALNLVFNGWFVYQWFREAIPLAQEYLSTGDLAALTSARLNELQLVISIIAYVLWLAYEVPALHSRGQTLGKMLLGIQVIPMEGPQRLPFRRCFRRWQWFGIPFLLFICCGIFGFILPIVDNIFVATDQFLHLAWHDRTARTFVVRVPPRNAPWS
jgi:uncharacterized RDD family membrane protein YckC